MLQGVLDRKLELLKTIYESIPLSDCDLEKTERRPHKSRRKDWKLICIFLGPLLAVCSIVYVARSSSVVLPTTTLRCDGVQIRREWRALSTNEKHDYFHAVNCLSTIQSESVLNGTLYDDFAWLHAGIGSWCHHSASFLPWHRYTLHLYEKRLREHCGFKGALPYWDWGMDWIDLAHSSIWDNETGFGGDGDISAPITVGDGHCVTNGPFSGLRPMQYNTSRTVHCLSRGFRDGKNRGRLPSSTYNPENIGRLLVADDYKTFVHEVENSVHNIMHLSIGGDFMALTAANDPIFYVHHAQLDHLWWRWQQENPQQRLKEYSGKHMYNSSEEAQLTDLLPAGGLADDLPVAQVMDTSGGFLCYRYG